jgi:hypothetical protein
MDHRPAGSPPDTSLVFENGEPAYWVNLPEPVNWLLAFGDNDWMLWAITPPGDLTDVTEVRVRLDPTQRRIIITGVAVLAGPGESIGAGLLRELPLGRLETVLNHRQLARHIRYLRVDPGVRTGFDFSPERALADSLFDEMPPLWTGDYKVDGVKAARRPDSFYEAVADAWTSAVINGEPNPAKVIAEANDVNLTAVHRWIREARKRGVMAPSSRPKASDRPDET